MKDTSRDPEDMHPLLRVRWSYLKRTWGQKYPSLPAPFLTATFRGPHDQEAARAAGRSHLAFGDSLHNYNPCYAFDIAFMSPDGGVDWSWHLFEKAAAILEPTGLQWGGRWTRLRDGPHFQLPMTSNDARTRQIPEMMPLDDTPTDRRKAADRKLVFLWKGEMQEVRDLPKGMDVVVRYAPDRERVYVDVREEEA